MRTGLFAMLASVLASGSVLAQAPPPPDLALKCQEILVKNCAKCHGKINPQSGMNITDMAYLTGNGYIAPGKPDESTIWDRISNEDESLIMPPGKPLPPEEREIIKQWILAGSPAVVDAVIHPVRPHISWEMMYAAIERDLRKYAPQDQVYMRYFCITHLHNNPGCSDRDLRMFRASFAKLVNSLSWESTIYRPEAIDEAHTIYRINLVKLGWVKDRLWNRILQQYPYGLSLDSHPVDAVRASYDYVYRVTGTKIPMIRADWFVAIASQPPLYEAMLRLQTGPGADKYVEDLLGVNVMQDFIEDRELRAGFVVSNVSQHNRLVARHPARFGAYWKSYDFKSSADRQNLLEAPLGPIFPGNKYARDAFEHDGGELIWHLPNGMQAYLLIDGKGKYIPKGPTEVVYDKNHPVDNVEVINGISCMACHAKGMQRFTDDVRDGHGLQNDGLIKVSRMYPPQKEWEQLLNDDADRFMSACKKCYGEHLMVEEDAQKEFDDFREPVHSIAEQYVRPLGLQDVVAELGYENMEKLKILFDDPEYRRYGLGVLTHGKVIKRETWDKMAPYSVFQIVAERLGLGTPQRVLP